jgi:hypothetical protein
VSSDYSGQSENDLRHDFTATATATAAAAAAAVVVVFVTVVVNTIAQ